MLCCPNATRAFFYNKKTWYSERVLFFRGSTKNVIAFFLSDPASSFFFLVWPMINSLVLSTLFIDEINWKKRDSSFPYGEKNTCIYITKLINIPWLFLYNIYDDIYFTTKNPHKKRMISRKHIIENNMYFKREIWISCEVTSEFISSYTVYCIYTYIYLYKQILSNCPPQAFFEHTLFSIFTLLLYLNYYSKIVNFLLYDVRKKESWHKINDYRKNNNNNHHIYYFIYN